MKILQNCDFSLIKNEAYKTTSSKYKFSNSEEIKDRLLDSGFKFEGLSIADVRNEDKRGYQKHIMVFDTGRQIDTENRVRLLVTNAHDASSSLKFNLGIYRTVCANGLIAGDDIFSERLIHTGQNFERDLYKIVASIPDMSDRLAANVIALQRKGYNEIDRLTYIAKILKFKHNVDGAMNEKWNPNDFRPIRNGDQGKNFYNLFNIVQEKVINGRYKFRGKKGFKKVRAVKSIDTNKKLNQFMFDEIINLAKVS